jgi:hypothetical protein
MYTQLIIICLLGLSANGWAACTIDIYGSKKVSAETLCQSFEKEIAELSNATMQDLTHNDVLESQERARRKIIYAVQAMGPFAYVNVTNVMYINEHSHVTVDIVEECDQAVRMIFKPEPTEDVLEAQNLIDAWKRYEKLGRELMINTEKTQLFQSCPAFHCIFGFEDPKLKEFEHYFRENVSRQKAALIKVLQKDKNPEKRGIAAYLLAHIEDPNELATILIEQIDDPSKLVRNNVMRVLGGLFEKEELENIPLDKMITALNYPDTTDRNKAMYMIDGLVKNPQYASYVKAHANDLLLEHVKLKQPNLHDVANQILGKIRQADLTD